MSREESELGRGGEPDGSERTRHWPGAAGPADYAVLEAVFVTGLVGLVMLALRRQREGSPWIPTRELPVLAVATFTLADVVAKERISTWVREPFVEEERDHKPVKPEGTGLRYAVGELLTCTRCIGTWSALGLVTLRTASPTAGRATETVLALAGANDLLQSGFRLLTERTNRAIFDTEAARRNSGRHPA